MSSTDIIEDEGLDTNDNTNTIASGNDDGNGVDGLEERIPEASELADDMTNYIDSNATGDVRGGGQAVDNEIFEETTDDANIDADHAEYGDGGLVNDTQEYTDDDGLNQTIDDSVATDNNDPGQFREGLDDEYKYDDAKEPMMDEFAVDDSYEGGADDSQTNIDPHQQYYDENGEPVQSGEFDEEEGDDALRQIIDDNESIGSYHSDGPELDDDNFDDGMSDDEARTQEELEHAYAERQHLLQINHERQTKVIAIFERKKNKRNQGAGDDKMNSAQNQDQVHVGYLKTLDQLSELWNQVDDKREEAEEKIDRLTQKLDLEDAQRGALAESFKKFKRQIARDASYSRTGKPIKLKRILAFEEAEVDQDTEVADIRLKHINLVSQLRQLEDQVKQKEELAEGLHLIDFEQLKIENQTLNEKIEERNDELHKLRKKTTTTVQVLTHIKEKLKFVEEENKLLKEKRGKLESGVKKLRDLLTVAKHQRDSLRSENVSLKQKQGFIGSDLLVDDFETRKSTLMEVREKVERLKNRHAQLVSCVNRGRRAEGQHQRMLAKGGGHFGTRGASTIRRYG